MSARGSIHEDNGNALFLIRCAHEIQDVRVVELLASFACNNDEEYKTFRLQNVDIAPVESTALFEFSKFHHELAEARDPFLSHE